MVAWLDGKEIVNTKVNNKDINNLKLVYDKYPGNVYYKLIMTPSFYDLALTNKTRFASEGYEKPEIFSLHHIPIKQYFIASVGLLLILRLEIMNLDTKP